VIRFRADWVLPVSGAPVRDGIVTIDRGWIVETGPATDGEPVVALRGVAILPGLVNAHTHFELSYLHGRIPPAPSFLDWVRPMLAVRAQRTHVDAPEILDAARAAIRQAEGSGTVLVGDVSNTLVTPRLLAESRLAAHVFHELLGFGGVNAGEQVAAARGSMVVAAGGGGDVRLSLAPHAPYSVSPALFAAIRADLDAHAPAMSSVHLAESPEEVELVKTGGGPWRSLLEGIGAWNEGWRVPGTSPVQYLADLGFLDRSVLAVHGVQMDRGDLDRLRALGSTLVSCPRSNAYVGVGAPPLETFYASGVDVAFGTDSLASVADLDMFAELAEARRIAPRVPARALIRSATLVGARALGFGAEYGSIEPGKHAALIAVRVPAGVTDVEEYLVSGVAPERVSWIGEATPRT